MDPHGSRRRTFDNLRKDAKRWLADIRANVSDARARLARALSVTPAEPTLRDVQLAVAGLQGFPGWAALKRALEPDPRTSARTLAEYEDMADALLQAYRTGTPEAMERHYRYTWHRRQWTGMRTYIQLDLGKRPSEPGGDVEIDLDDARALVAHEYGFESWAALRAFVATMPGQLALTRRPVQVLSHDGAQPRTTAITRDWAIALHGLRAAAAPAFHAHGEMTDAMLAELATVTGLVSLDLSGSQAVTDEGVRHLAGLEQLRKLDLTGTRITDRGLAVLRQLPRLEHLSMAMTVITDGCAPDLAACDGLRSLELGGTWTGDGAIRAMAGKPHLHSFRSGQAVTDEGLAALHDLPIFKTWRGGIEEMGLTSYDAGPNYLALRGSFGDRGLQHLRGLDGLFALNIDDSALPFTAAGLASLVSLPRLGWLALDARDDWMPYIGEMPRLRFLGAQDTSAGDEGFAALARSRTIEYIWGRRCHNLRRRGFLALSTMPALRALSVSCLNVDDEGISSLPAFPALRELMPMDVPDGGYRHVGRCADLESLVLMYCRNTTDAATEHLTGLRKLTSYFNSYTTITDRTPELLATMPSLEGITLDNCHRVTNAGIATLARLPRLARLRVNSQGVTRDVRAQFRPEVEVDIE